MSHWISDSGFGVLSLSAFGDEPLQPIESAWPIEIQEVDSIATKGLALFMEAGVVLVDHYSLDSTWEKPLNEQDIKVIALDDLEERSHSASCVIRPGLPNCSSNDSGLSQNELEHVTLGFHSRGDRFKINNVSDSINNSRLRWTVDTEEDFTFVSWVYSNFVSQEASFTSNSVYSLLSKFPSKILLDN